MPYSVAEIAEARGTLAELLSALQLDAYLFEIEPRDDMWELTVECAIDDGWETVKLSVSKGSLLLSRTDESNRLLLLNTLRDNLASCKSRPASENR